MISYFTHIVHMKIRRKLETISFVHDAKFIGRATVYNEFLKEITEISFSSTQHFFIKVLGTISAS